MNRLVVYIKLLFILSLLNACGGTVQSETYGNNTINIPRVKSNNLDFYALEVNAKNGIPIIGGDIIALNNYQSYYSFKYDFDVKQIRYSTTIRNITLLGDVNKGVVTIPYIAKFMEVMFIQNGNYIFKIFEIFPSIKSL